VRRAGSPGPAPGGPVRATPEPVDDAAWAIQALDDGVLPELLARADAATTERVVISLQRTGGNEVVQRLGLAGVGPDGERPPVAQRAGPVVQRALPVAQRSAPVVQRASVPTPEELQKAIDDEDVGAIKGWDSYGSASTSQVRSMIKIISRQGWVGFRDERALIRLWSAMGADMSTMSQSDVDLFASCVEVGMPIDSFGAVAGLRLKWRDDVVSVGVGNLRENRKLIVNEMGALGLQGEPGVTPASPEDQQKALAERQKVAKEMEDLQKAMKLLGTIKVGFSEMKAPTYGQSDEGEQNDTGVVRFDPSGPPPVPAEDVAGFVPWETVKKSYDELTAEVTRRADANPALFALLAEGELSKATDDDPEKAKAAMGEQLLKVIENTRTTEKEIQDSSDLYLDLRPVHEALIGGNPAASGTVWSKPFNKWLAREEMKSHQASQERLATLLGAAGLVAMVVASLATAGGALAISATVAGLTASGMQAGMSWDKYMTLETAAKSTVRSDLGVVEQSQADAELFMAVLNTAFALVDLGGAVAGAGKTLGISPKAFLAGRTVRKAALEALEKEIGVMSAAKVGQSINEFGLTTVEAAWRKAGRPIEELGPFLRKDASLVELAEMVEGHLKLGKGADKAIMSLLDEALKSTDQVALDAAARDALLVLGPKGLVKKVGGWKSLGKKLGASSKTMIELDAWRMGIFNETKAFIEGLEGGEKALIATGTPGPTSDLDMSTLGVRSAENREAAKSYMAARAGTTPGDLELLLDAGFFTDPRRLHIGDYLAPEVRRILTAGQVEQERELILRMALSEAEKGGDRKAIEAVEEMMGQAGISNRVPLAPLQPSAVAKLNEEIDALHAQLKQLADSGADAAEQVKVARDIVERQAMINATEKGGYFGGGTVAKEVTEREAARHIELLQGMSEEQLKSQLLIWKLDQLPKLFKSVPKLASQKIEVVVEAIKDMGKYVRRFAVDLPSAAAQSAATSGGSFESIAKKFEQWELMARGDAQSMEKLAALKGIDPANKAELRTAYQQLAVEGNGLQAEVAAAYDEFLSTLPSIHKELSTMAEMGKDGSRLAQTSYLLFISAQGKILKDNSLFAITAVIRRLEAGQAEGDEEVPAPGAGEPKAEPSAAPEPVPAGATP